MTTTTSSAPGDPTGGEQQRQPAPTPESAVDAQRAFAELGMLMLDQPLGQYLQRVADPATDVLPGVDGLSVTLIEDGRAHSAAFTSPGAAQLDERQYETGFRPCMDAATSGEIIRVDITSAATAGQEATYPAFTRAARRQGVRSVTSVGMPVPQRVTGALNMYSTTTEGLDADTLALARTFATYAAVALANASLYGATARLATQLEEAMTSRAVIEQAKGILMVQLSLDADQAFARLSKASQDSNTKLRDMAADIVTRAIHGQMP